MNNENTGNDPMQDAPELKHSRLVNPKSDFGRSIHMARLIHQFGGAKKLAKACNCTVKNVYHWTDHIAPEPAWQLLAYARRNGFDNITLEMIRPDLDFGKKPKTTD